MAFHITESGATMVPPRWLRILAWALAGVGLVEVGFALAAGHTLLASSGLPLVLMAPMWLRMRVDIDDSTISWMNGGLRRSLPLQDVEAVEVDYTRNQFKLRTSERTVRVHAALPSDFGERDLLESIVRTRVSDVATVPARTRTTADR